MSNSTIVYEETLDGVTGLGVDAEQMDLAIEPDDSLDGIARLIVNEGKNAPFLQKKGTQLRIDQQGAYRTNGTPVLRLPAGIELPAGIHIRRGDVAVEGLNGPLAVRIQHGDASVRDGRGNIACNVQRGDVDVAGRVGDIVINIAHGHIALSRCTGNQSVSTTHGDIAIANCGQNISARTTHGDIAIARPQEATLEIESTRGDIAISGGSAIRLRASTNHGDITSSTRLLFTGEDDSLPDDAEPAVDEDVAESESDEEGGGVHFTLGGMEFIATEHGVRLSRGGTDVFRAGPEGVEVRRGDGSEIFVASERGIGKRSAADEELQYRFATKHGTISLSLPEDQATRVELLVTSGSVRSDIPLVEVGRPGPRGTTRRYVGVSDSSATERVLVRAQTTRGDIRIRLVPMDEPKSETRSAERQTSSEERRRRVLEALSQGKLTVEEADVLLAAIERER